MSNTARYCVFIGCRAAAIGLGYTLSIVGFAYGNDFGRLVAFLDAAKPASGLLDTLALRAYSRLIACEMLIVKALILLCTLILISAFKKDLFVTGIIGGYLVIWWSLTSYATAFMREQGVSGYLQFCRHAILISRFGVRRVLTDRSTILLLVTSTISALAYSSLYFFSWSRHEFIALRIIDGTLLVVSFAAQLVIRGESVSRLLVVINTIAVALAAGISQYITDGWFGLFLLLRVGSLFACARALRYRADRLISINQIFLSIAFLVFSVFAENSTWLKALLLIECISLFTLVRYCRGSKNHGDKYSHGSHF